LNFERIPVLKLGSFLLVTVQGTLEDRTALALQEDLTRKVEKTGAGGVLVDISGLDLVDSFVGRMLYTLTAVMKLMDVETVVVGMQPAVAMTLVELGLNLPGTLTAMNVDRGLELLRQRLRSRSAC
jgi:rsbT antagonist protein RsbS